MNTTALRLLPALAATAAALAVLTSTSDAAVLPAPVVLMPTVHVIGHRDALRSEVVELPAAQPKS